MNKITIMKKIAEEKGKAFIDPTLDRSDTAFKKANKESQLPIGYFAGIHFQ